MMRAILLALAGALALGDAAQAQTLCTDSETVMRCWDRLEAEITDQVLAAAAKAQDDVKKRTETGVLETINGLNSSAKDFLPLLQLTGVLGQMEKDDKTGVVTVALNTPLYGPAGKTADRVSQLKGLIETAPSLYEPLKQKLPLEGREQKAKDLLGATPGESMALQWSWNLTSGRWGRAFATHQPLLNALFQQIVQSSDTRTETVKASTRLFALDAVFPRDKAFSTATMFEVADTATPEGRALRRRIEERLLEAVRADIALRAAFEKAVSGSGLEFFGQMINNQPQLHLTATYWSRDDLYGPDQRIGRVTYEIGLGNNLNAFMKRSGARDCRANIAKCAEELRAFTKDPAVKARIKGGARLAVFAEFARADAYDFTVPGTEARVNSPEGTAVSLGFDYGQLVAVQDDGTAGARIEASVRYERPADRTIADERFVASLTLTKKVGETSIPFGLIYANKPQYITGATHHLSANVGLRFNLFAGFK